MYVCTLEDLRSHTTSTPQAALGNPRNRETTKAQCLSRVPPIVSRHAVSESSKNVHEWMHVQLRQQLPGTHGLRLPAAHIESAVGQNGIDSQVITNRLGRVEAGGGQERKLERALGEVCLAAGMQRMQILCSEAGSASSSKTLD